ncbi:peptide transport system permease protein [Lacticaseibacillus paracasei]|nr:peptide transport system permease protein [Lacticaseibacillus paracasei]
MISVADQAELVIRLVVAALCGFAIGYERKNRFKNAGIRTHMIVALGAALIMIVSKYGFLIF